MEIQKLKHIIFKSSSNLMRSKGEQIFKKGSVIKVRGKKIANIYHIYGELRIDNISNFNTHIKINLSTNRLDGASCNCEMYREFAKNKPLFICEHIAATNYKFLDSIVKSNSLKEKNRNFTTHKSTDKIQLNLSAYLITTSFKDHMTFEIEFRIGMDRTYIISNLKQFLSSIYKKETIPLAEGFIFDPSEYTFSDKDLRTFEYINQIISIKNKSFSSNRLLTLKPEQLRSFLQTITNKKIKFKYKGIEYSPTILMENLPLNFTLKDDSNDFILTTHKKLPIPIDNVKTVFFYNGDIYLPSDEQIKIYLPLYNRFLQKEFLSFTKTIDNYKMLISNLKKISKDLTISESIKSFNNDYVKFEFTLYKEKEQIYCQVLGVYLDDKVDILKENTTKPNSLRDFRLEEKILMKLENYKLVKNKDRLIFIGEDEDLYNLISKGSNSLNALGKVILSNGLDNIKIYNSSDIELSIIKGQELFDLNYKIGEMDISELNSAFEAFKSGSNFYKGKDSNFLAFEDEGIFKLFNLLDLLSALDTSIDGSISMSYDKLFYIKELLQDTKFKIKDNSKMIDLLTNSFDTFNEDNFDIPKTLTASLREYQVKGYKWFKTLSALGLGGILADDMGLGKTLQTISFISSESNKKFLIITPTSLIYNWKDEFEKFAPGINFQIIHGTMNKGKDINELLKDNDVILTTYGTLKNNRAAYDSIVFDYCIIDEAQNIKNPDAITTKSVKGINAKNHFALTGTPIENNLLELWSIFDFILPNYLYTKEVFQNKFLNNNEAAFDSLRKLIKPFILRRTKGEVIKELPDKIEKKVLVDMTSPQKAIYSTYIKEVRQKLKSNTDGKIEIFSYLTKLRQICLEPSLVFPNYKSGSGKLKMALTIINEQVYNDRKILLFSQFTSALAIIKDKLSTSGIDYYYIDGTTPAKERLNLVNKFNEKENNVKVFLISLKAGGTGLNLTSANLVIHFDPWWNPAVENQATDRAHRIGQKNVVEVIKLVAKGTIEEKILELQASKKALIESILTGDLKNSDSLNNLTKEDLLKLFEKDL